MTPSEPMILHSAHRHGVTNANIAHAWRNPIGSWEVDEGMTILIGPDHTAQLLEIGVVDSDEGPAVVHAMRARSKFL